MQPQLIAGTDAVATYVQDYGMADDAVEQALGFATSLVQAATGQHLFYVADDAVLLPWNSSGWIELPERPVHTVGQVVYAGAYGAADLTLARTDWTLVHGNLALRGPGGAPGAGSPAGLAVTYTHGYLTMPMDLQAVAVGVAVRMMHKSAERFNESLDNYTLPASTAGPATLTPSELAVCRRYRRTTFSSAGGTA